MDIISAVLSATELIGTVAFALSGALTGIDRGLDLFGVLVMGALTATGGGILRDVCIGRTPPAIFSNTGLLLLAVGTALLVFIIMYVLRADHPDMRGRVEKIYNLFDAVGLAAFSVMGTETVMSAGWQNNAALCLILGMLTGVGGGMLRDVCTCVIPDIFRRHVYAVASLLGCAICFAGGLLNIPVTVRMPAGMIAIFVIRVLAARYEWSLPKVTSKQKR